MMGSSMPSWLSQMLRVFSRCLTHAIHSSEYMQHRIPTTTTVIVPKVHASTMKGSLFFSFIWALEKAKQSTQHCLSHSSTVPWVVAVVALGLQHIFWQWNRDQLDSSCYQSQLVRQQLRQVRQLHCRNVQSREAEGEGVGWKQREQLLMWPAYSIGSTVTDDGYVRTMTKERRIPYNMCRNYYAPKHS